MSVRMQARNHRSGRRLRLGGRLSGLTAGLTVAFALSLAGCGPRPAAESGAEGSLFGKTEIVEQGGGTAVSGDWPRVVRDALGHVVEIPAPPQRIHTLSIGYDEITLALVDPGRVAAVGKVTANPAYSNIAAIAKQIPHQIDRDAEQIIAVEPDLVVASPFADTDLVTQLREAGLRVVVSDLQDSIELHAENIRLLARLYGAEARAEELIGQIERRLRFIEEIVAGQLREHPRPRVIRLSARGSTPGRHTTMDGIIRHAGGINAAAVAEIERWQQISLEKVVELQPEVIIIGAGDAAEEGFQAEILEHPVLAGVPAVIRRRVHTIPDRFISTLSHWNIRGVEELAKLLWPGALGDVTFADGF